MTYLLDSNVFIQSKNLHYGMDFCPAFWDWLLEKNQLKEVFSIEKVGDEIDAGDDDLSRWAAKRGSLFFLKPDQNVVMALSQVSKWATSQRYEPSAVNLFFQVADYYLVAHALAHNFVVVTQEITSTSTKKIKIPDACHGLGIKCMTPYTMLRHERARFVLGHK
ncbi:MAG: DUF4411 family protein [Deltaproteobacteria bacterium]|nr:DUF4411 family protein [Deltaproteobacteria bacterium]